MSIDDSSPPPHPCEAQWLPLDPSSSKWSDVPPTHQEDGPGEVLVGILYDPRYSSAMDLFRTLYPRKELSARALAVTSHLTALNPSNYSIWSYRADILIDAHDEDLGGDPKATRLRRELDWMEEMAARNMKSYQVWQHRRLIVSALQDPSAELAFTASVLAKDSKNYHTWAYRQWTLAQFGGIGQKKGKGSHPELWDGELSYTTQLIDEDVRNNSAWNHRFFVLFGSGSSETPRDVLETEIQFTKSQLSQAPSNAAAWAYLRGILSHTQQPLSSFDLPVFVRNLGRDSPAALEYTLDAAEEALESPTSSDGLTLLIAASASATTPEQGLDMLIERLNELDPVRQRWWESRGVDVRALVKARAS